MRRYLALSCILGTSLIAQDCYFNSCDCDEGPQEARLTIRHREAGGIGYPDGYTSLDYFYAPSASANFHPFFDARAHVFNNGKTAFNAGLGLRYLPDCSDVVWGTNLYWDFREAKHASFNQAALGFEALWPCVDLHLNFFAPFTRHKKGYRQGFSGFQGNEAFFYRKYELALWGSDLTLGYKLYNNCWFGLHTALGGYYLHGDYGIQAGGGLLRATISAWDYVTLEGQVSYDSLFKWNGQGELAISFPFGKVTKRYPRKTTCCDDIIALENRLVEKPTRFEIIATTSHKKRGRALDPDTGLPLTFFFVDNTSNSAGTFESPFPTLAQALAVAKVDDAIYIFPGDGTSTGLNLNSVLKNGQKLIGSGAPVLMKTRFGDIVLPRQTDNLPTISGTGPMITLANRNIVSGLLVRSTNDVAIRGTGVRKFGLIKLVLDGNQGGINVTGAGEELRVEGVRFLSSANTQAFVEITREADLYFLDNEIERTDGKGFEVRTNLTNAAPEAEARLNFERNRIQAEDRSLDVRTSMNSRVYASVRNNDFKGTPSSPNEVVRIMSEDAARIRVDYEYNKAEQKGTTFAAAFIADDTSQMNLRLTKTTASAPNDPPYYFSSTINAKLTVQSPNGADTGVSQTNGGIEDPELDGPPNGFQFTPLQ